MSLTLVLPKRRKPISLRESLATLFSDASTFAQNLHTTTSRNISHSKFKSFFTKKKIGTYAFILIILIIVVGGLRIALRQGSVNGASTSAQSDDTKTTSINRDFSIIGYDEEKKKSDNVKYTLTDAQLTREIIIKGQKAKAVAGRAFLIINLKLVNDFNHSLFLNTRNYVRVQPKGGSDKLAPEIHNDTVEVQPLSTKLTRIGLPVNDTDHEFSLFIGELDGEKQEIPIAF